MFPPSCDPQLQSLPPAEYGGKTLIEYVWLGSSGSDLRSKTQVLDFRPSCVEDVPIMAVDGSSYGMAPEDNEVFLKPRKIFCDPFRGGGHLLVLCDSFQAHVDTLDNAAVGAQGPVFKPHPANNRAPCEDVTNRAGDSGAAFAVEQEYTVMARNGAPAGTACRKTAMMQGLADDAHCREPAAAVVTAAAPRPASPCVARAVAEKHLRSCLDAGVNIAGMSQRNSGAAWSYKIGPSSGLDMADQLWVSRFLMLRVSEAEGVTVSFDPLASGGERGRCPVEYSTAATRHPGLGLVVIQKQIEALQAAHLQHALAYGKGSLRLLSDSQFSVGVGGKAAAIMVPTATLLQQAGHYVDCRPASNMDPYLVVMMLLSTTLQLQLPAMQTAPLNMGMDNNINNYVGRSAMAHSSTHSSISQAWPMQAGRCCSWAGCSDDEDDCLSINSEEVLIDELDKLDAMGPNTPPRYSYMLGESLMEEGFDESCSDGSSPDRSCM